MENPDDRAISSQGTKTPSANTKRLEGKVAIITGGASGIGACAAKLFCQSGAKVVIADIDDLHGLTLAADLGPTAAYIHCNVCLEDDIIHLVNATVSIYGKLDVMFNNAGIIDGIEGSSILAADKSSLERVLNVNLVGAFLGAKHAARAMVAAGSGGCILFTASAAACIAGLSTHAYTVSKHAVVGLAKSLAAELGQKGIRVNCVSPFAVSTNFAKGMGEFTEELEQRLSELGNLKGVAVKAEDVAAAALFLASDEARYVSGVNLVVDGGFSIVNPSLINAFTSPEP